MPWSVMSKRTTAQWAFIQRVETIDKTDSTVKLRHE